jgi:hypothetical protein
MDLLLAWVVFPLQLVLVCAGLGLLLERLCGLRLAGALVVPSGLALLVVLAQLTTTWSATARVTTPLVVLAAVGGLVAGRRRLSPRGLDVAALACAAGAFAVLGAPVFLTGEATFAGYTVLGDTSVQLVAIDRLLEHGRSLAGLSESSYRTAIKSYLDAGYPMGAQVALGAVRPLAGQDVAWVYQPFLSFLVANLALALYALVRPLVAACWLRALVAFLAAQPALVMGYALQGSIKELATAWLVALMVALVAPLLVERAGVRAAVPLAVAAAAAVAAIGPAALVWLGPILLAALVGVVVLRASWGEVARRAGLFAAAMLALSIPALVTLRGYADVAQGVITSAGELGNLLGPLHLSQVVGIWLVGDYRVEPAGEHLGVSLLTATHALIAVALASGVLGVAWAARRRALLPLLYVAVSLIACLYVMRAGSPWAEGKAFMIVSPAVLLAALLGPVALAARGQARGSAAAGLLLLAIGGGVLASNALAYRGVSVAPRDRFEELARIGEREGGAGPALVTEFEEFAKHFLRDADPVDVNENASPGLAGAARPEGPGVRFGYPNDLDDLTLAYVERYRTLVLRRSPIASRPPANYRRVSSSRWYEVWRRTSAPSTVLEHVPLGASLSPSGRARCTDLAALAARARAAGARLAAAERMPPASFDPTHAQPLPTGWSVDGGEPFTLDVNGRGAVAGTIRLPRSGRYAAWLGGSFARPTTATVDGRGVVRVGGELSGREQFAPGRTVVLAAGTHRVRVARDPRSLAPGDGNGASRRIGPLVLQPVDAAVEPLLEVAPRAWRALCGRPLDWVELVRR